VDSCHTINIYHSYHIYIIVIHHFIYDLHHYTLSKIIAHHDDVLVAANVCFIHFHYARNSANSSFGIASRINFSMRHAMRYDTPTRAATALQIDMPLREMMTAFLAYNHIRKSK
jgi:hypothetical protein